MSGISSHCDPMWEDTWVMAKETLAHTLCEEAITRIVEPVLNKVENTVVNAWGRLCDEHLPAEQQETARRYHRLMEDAPVVRSSTDLRLIMAMIEGMRDNVDPLATLETIFQAVCAAAGLSDRAGLALVFDEIGENRLEEFRALFPNVVLAIGDAR